MRRNPVIGATLLILVLGAAQGAEARGRAARGGFRSATIGSAAVVSTGSIAAAPTVTSVPASDPTLRPVKALAAPTPPAREVRAADSWCANRRVVGTGTGFCLIN
ncbi:hypothetical protein MKK58_00905 [Methylobacterium sp. J-078]|uniref:hypothetical protein n=1 Tax=Methylobacterium sp. J-078 TaxID=2836657 RepID=UPI001FB9488C|nr:hypothetical protein [Methylobacterium sp. J-078]MCJ2043113.1 hypothetical protein [Methylobacterium sp. J-078]